MKIIQLLVTLHRGDAIGNFTLTLNEMLIQAGYDALIYAYYIGDNINEKVVRNIGCFSEAGKSDLIIYQMCEGHEINNVIRKQHCRKIAIYHNATPSEYFVNYGREYYHIQSKARKVIASMHDQFERCIADSEYNKTDLVSMGYDEKIIDVIPLIINFSDYSKQPDKKLIDQYNDNFVNILFVGRIVPNKKQEDVVRAFTYYHKYINSKSRLFIIGSPFIADYADALTEYINYLGIGDSVIMPGHTKFSEILAYYKCADIFLCMSEHEGFCVPLIEAMIFDIPVVAFKSSAIPFTMAGSGVLVDTKDPSYLSDIINSILSDSMSAEKIIVGQKQRLEYFRTEKVKELYIKEINSILGEE